MLGINISTLFARKEIITSEPAPLPELPVYPYATPTGIRYCNILNGSQTVIRNGETWEYVLIYDVDSGAYIWTREITIAWTWGEQ